MTTAPFDDDFVAKLRTEVEYRLRTIAWHYRSRGNWREEPRPGFLDEHIDGGTADVLRLLTAHNEGRQA